MADVAEVRRGQASWVLPVQSQMPADPAAMPHPGVGWELPQESISPRGSESGEGNLLVFLQKEPGESKHPTPRVQSSGRGRLTVGAISWPKGKCGT